ncbi:MAG TPA: PilZ domain-containing protein [Thermoanaerobaculia bacterium]|nr:PilZ domain-containing protein [Thermoanaerobaculia bacterium]
MQDERREYQRLHLTRPLEGRYGRSAVRVIDVSATGALVEHDRPLRRGAQRLLHFTWRDHKIAVKAEIVRSAGIESGLRFTEENELLLQLIAQSAEEVLRAQQANLQGDRESNVVGDETLTAASAGLSASGYVVWTLGEGGWQKRRALLPDQPDDGFTVGAAEPPEQVDLLRQTWERGDEEARRMTRMLAELSAATRRKS